MVSFKVRLDWLSVTGKLNPREGDVYESGLLSRARLAENILRDITGKEPQIETVSAARYYEVSFVDRHSKLRVNLGSDLLQQGWQVVASGAACPEFNANEVLPGFLEIWRGKVTRCDIAIDLIGLGFSPAMLADEYREEHGEDGRRNWSFIKGKTGDTCYIGSRSSDRMLRYYDKGAEQNIPVDWIRCEMEYKGAYAQHALETFLHDYRSSVAAAADFISLPHSGLDVALRKIAMGKTSEVPYTPRVVGDRVKWFHSQVVQSYMKVCDENLDDAREIWEKFHEIYMAASIYKMLEEQSCKIRNIPVHSDL